MTKLIPIILLLGAHLMSAENETIVLGAGCFWCVEAVYERIDGVEAVEAGYSNGQTNKPTYKEVCSGNTGFAEVVRVTFDPQKVTYSEILDIFWKAHDPTTLNRQGADVGTVGRIFIIVVIILMIIFSDVIILQRFYFGHNIIIKSRLCFS